MNPLEGFDGAGLNARLARREETIEIQTFNEANADYWLLTHGYPPPSDDAASAFDLHPGNGMSYSADPWFVVRENGSSTIVGHVACAIDLMAKGVVHLGFFLIARALRGTGFARRVHDAYETWALTCGARWLRLCVVEVNTRGQRFWTRRGYSEIKRVDGFQLGNLTHTLITMVRPLGSNTLGDYLEHVPRDRADEHAPVRAA